MGEDGDGGWVQGRWVPFAGIRDPPPRRSISSTAGSGRPPPVSLLFSSCSDRSREEDAARKKEVEGEGAKIRQEERSGRRERGGWSGGSFVATRRLRGGGLSIWG